MKKQQMTHISLKSGDYKIVLEVPVNKFHTVGQEVILQIIKILQELDKTEGEYAPLFEHSTFVKKEKKVQTVPSNTKDEFKVRERLPNNVVDINSLDIAKANTENNTVIRCPECGQAHCAITSVGTFLFFLERDFTNNEFKVIIDSFTQDEIEGLCYKEEKMTKKMYFEDLQGILKKSKNTSDFVVSNETEIFCPVCTKSHKFIEWKKAYIEPLQYFDTEHICDICGGETITKLHKNNKNKEICEICGNEEESDFVE